MGQQQLLLLILTSIVVGLAAIVGIQAFDTGAARANQDALVQTAVSIATDVQANARTPTLYGGAGLSSSSFPGSYSPSLTDFGYATDDGGRLSTPDGECFFVKGGSPTSTFDASSVPSLSDDPAIVIGCESGESAVKVGIEGLDRADISTAATLL